LYQYLFNKRIVQAFQQAEGHEVETATSALMAFGAARSVPPLAAAVQTE
jgi:hypothetical protein